jgi:predicted alpha-1,6-mannanase (GH76 family)
MIFPKSSCFGLFLGLVFLHIFHPPTGDPAASFPAVAQAETRRAKPSPTTRFHLEAGMVALQGFYQPDTGLWETAKWWNSANVLETTIDYSLLTNDATYRSTIANTFEKLKSTQFMSPWFYDDEGWWALAWIKAYDLTGEPRYLDMAKTLFEDMRQGWDTECNGGVWWLKNRTYKNAITNELFLTIAARLHLRTPNDQGPGSYLDWAKREWIWFQQHQLVNADNLVNDGLNETCQNNQQTTWTYNQGVILGGLVDLYNSTGEPALLIQAEKIADAAIVALAPNGVLREPCEPSDCGVDGLQFKGIFIRNLFYLHQATGKPTYKAFILNNAASILAGNRNSISQFGLVWRGPFDQADAVRQSSALDAVNAAIGLNQN